MSAGDKLPPACRYGDQCYRKNPLHFAEFSHPGDREESLPPAAKKARVHAPGDVSGGPQPSTSTSMPATNAEAAVEASASGGVNSNVVRDERGTAAAKSARISKPPNTKKPVEPAKSKDRLECKLYLPLRLTFTRVAGLDDDRFNQRSVTFSDVIGESGASGALQSALLFNYMFDISWIVAQCPRLTSVPVLLIHGFSGHEKTALHEDASKYSNICLAQARLEPYGTHHTKMCILQFANGLRVVIMTANLVAKDWHQKTQLVWISPLLTAPQDAPNAAPTPFQADLVEYLEGYKLAALKPWTEVIRVHDFSQVRGRLVGSTPGRHTTGIDRWGHLRLRALLKQADKSKEQKSCWYVCQFSSIGSLGTSADKWLTNEFLTSLRASSVSSGLQSLEGSASLKLVYPCVEDVRMSLEGYMGGTSLPYNRSTAEKQPWLVSFMHKWRCENFGRSRANPHVKSYAAITSQKEIKWYLMTSANLSKAAWGCYEKGQSQLMIRSYELGVLFLPSDFGKSCFMPPPTSLEEAMGRAGAIVAPLPFDWPLTKYESSDRAWIVNEKSSKPDSQGCVWCPT